MLSVENLSTGYTAVNVIRDVTLEIPSNTIGAVLGAPTGPAKRPSCARSADSTG